MIIAASVDRIAGTKIERQANVRNMIPISPQK
jgi:hypothetical protein